jgi:hypothetical protein
MMDWSESCPPDGKRTSIKVETIGGNQVGISILSIGALMMAVKLETMTWWWSSLGLVVALRVADILWPYRLVSATGRRIRRPSAWGVLIDGSFCYGGNPRAMLRTRRYGSAATVANHFLSD